jgi:hypothetical protein
LDKGLCNNFCEAIIFLGNASLRTYSLGVETFITTLAVSGNIGRILSYTFNCKGMLERKGRQEEKREGNKKIRK